MEIPLNGREIDVATMEMSLITTNAVFDHHNTPFHRR
jgi:hypothetical protein